MARLFTALIPPAEALDDLAGALAGVGSEASTLRWSTREQWHITLGFFGDADDPEQRIPWLHARVSGLAAPELRLAGVGSFPGVLWVRASPADEHATGQLLSVAEAAGASHAGKRRPFRPHLTIARWKRAPGIARVAASVAEALAGYRGPSWRPADVALIRSQPGPEGHSYQVLSRAELRSVN
ncbi:MAG: RNA 2',3'-cyclic phosphodiesterase [Pseudonocardiaceae bacterium]|nr:RNA 2',3'-cyclic phosphodiesterase [Pseudonocardiaceae bacterium]